MVKENLKNIPASFFGKVISLLNKNFKFRTFIPLWSPEIFTQMVAPAGASGLEAVDFIEIFRSIFTLKNNFEKNSMLANSNIQKNFRKILKIVKTAEKY